MMDTPIEQGLYTDGSGRVCEIVPHPEQGCGWLAYGVREIIRHHDTRGGTGIDIIRASIPPIRVKIEFWQALQKFEVPGHEPGPIEQKMKAMISEASKR
jgi:hypothetical protein